MGVNNENMTLLILEALKEHIGDALLTFYNKKLFQELLIPKTGSTTETKAMSQFFHMELLKHNYSL